MRGRVTVASQRRRCVADAAVAAAVQRLREEEEERRINKRELVLHAALALPHPSLTNSISVCLYGTDCA